MLPPLHAVSLASVLFACMGVGGWLLLTARTWPEGREPHCIRCGYNLTGLQSSRCPECGIETNDDNCIAGAPSRMQWGRFALGALLVGMPVGAGFVLLVAYSR